MPIDITEDEAHARLQKLSAERKEAKLTGPKLLEGLITVRAELDRACFETMRLVQTKIERCLPDGEISTVVVAGVLGTPGADEVRSTNIHAIRPRTNALRGAILRLDNTLHELRRIVFAREGFSQRRLDQAIAAGTIPADPGAYLEKVLSEVPVADPGRWTIIDAPKE
jgi:hypothetical protein